MIRERFRLAGEVRVRTAQGRLTAVVLVALPLVMLLVLHMIDPAYVNLLFSDRLGHIMLIMAVGLQAVGGVVIWKIVNIKA